MKNTSSNTNNTNTNNNNNTMNKNTLSNTTTTSTTTTSTNDDNNNNNDNENNDNSSYYYEYDYDLIRSILMDGENDNDKNDTDDDNSDGKVKKNDSKNEVVIEEEDDDTNASNTNTNSANSNITNTNIKVRYVTVNQRLLIDKILTRYASSYSIYRELIQNSNDANATHVHINFICNNTKNTTSNNSTSKEQQQLYVTNVIYQNNGIPFRNEDWDRIHEIANGNPNPNKIGTFGVGSYTMFSICNHPMIISANECCIFCWNSENHLYTKQLLLKEDNTTTTRTSSNNDMKYKRKIKKKHDTNNNNNNNNNNNTTNTIHHEPYDINYTTTFVLPSRDYYQIPDIDNDFGNFLLSTLSFTNKLHTIYISVNYNIQLCITKSIVCNNTTNNNSRVIPIPPIVKNTSTLNMTNTMLQSSSLYKSTSSLLFNYVKTNITNSNSNNNTNSITNKITTSTDSNVTTTIPKHLLRRNENQNHNNTTNTNTNNNIGIQLQTELFTIQDPIHENIIQFIITVYNNHHNYNNTMNTIDTSQSLVSSISSSSYTIYVKHITTLLTTHISNDIMKKIQRIMKKVPPSNIPIQLLLPHYSYSTTTTNSNNMNTKDTTNNSTKDNDKLHRIAKRIAISILPSSKPYNQNGGRIYIGYRTSQTTGLYGVHVMAPFIPTVEREAMDVQDPICCIYNTELLYCTGILLRYILEYTMFTTIHTKYQQNMNQYQTMNEQLLQEYYNTNTTNDKNTDISSNKLVNNNNNDDFDFDYYYNNDDDDDDDDEYEDEDNSTSNNDNTTNGTTTKSKFTVTSSRRRSNNNNTSLFGLAKYMAKGVSKQLGSVTKSINDIIETTGSGITTTNFRYNNRNGSNNHISILHPPDLRPLSDEEKYAIMIMKTYIPIQPSTPDPMIGTKIIQGFIQCLPNHILPPVLCNNSGVVHGGTVAKLPYYGIEQFISSSSGSSNNNSTNQNVIRSKIYKYIEPYHTIVAQCSTLQYNDLYMHLQNNILQQSQFIRLIQWWTQFCYVNDTTNTNTTNASRKVMIQNRGIHLKDVIRFFIEKNKDDKNTTQSQTTTQKVMNVSQYQFYIDQDSIFHTHTDIPLPYDIVLPKALHDAIGMNVLRHETINDVWFSPMPMEIFTEYISHHDCMNLGKPEDDLIRIKVLTILCREYSRRTGSERVVFGGLCHSLLSSRRCIPFDSDLPTQYAADYPTDLYLNDAELHAFASIGSFHKVSNALQNHPDMKDEFLILLGVRKSVSIDFLFTHLDELCWNSNPKPLIDYLYKHSMTLTKSDYDKLSTSKYLPAAAKINDNDNTTSTTKYAPFELYLPNDKLQILPFIKMLAWPESTTISEKSDIGKFLCRLGMKVTPSLLQVLSYLVMPNNNLSDEQHLDVLDFLCDRLVPHGIYYSQYNNMSYNDKKKYPIVPCIVQDLIQPNAGTSSTATATMVKQRQSPVSCFSDITCAVMGFPVIDPKLGKKGTIYCTLLQCDTEPPANYLLNQLKHLVALAKDRAPKVDPNVYGPHIITSFKAIFKYLSQRSSEMNYSSLEALGRESFIPCLDDNNKLVWYRPNDVFFRRTNKTNDNDTVTEELFHVIDFNPFLAAAGVKEEATTADLFLRILSSPQDVLNTLGSEKKYRALLRRIAADPPFPISRPPANIKNSPFLLAYQVKPYVDKSDSSNGDNLTHQLAKADDIYVIDNSNYGRMFTVNRAPPESDLEDFYIRLGAHYISKSVERRFEVVGSPKTDTTLTIALRDRVRERGPLLVSPNITSRPLVSGAASILNDKMLEFYEAPNLLAVYSLGKVSRRSSTTCFSKPNRQKNALYITPDFDLFDVGQAIGDLILKRCMLEDAFFISSLLDTPLEQLRARGFPVDRISKSEPVVPEKPKPAPSVPTIVPLPQPSKKNAPNNVDSIAASASTLGQPNKSLPSNGNDKKPSSSPVVPEDSKPPATLTGSKADILMQMFPDADPSFIQAALGPNPSVDDVKELADTMTNGHYPKKSTNDSSTIDKNEDDTRSIDTSNDSFNPNESSMKKKSLRQRLGGAFSNKRRSGTSTMDGINNVIPPTIVTSDTGTTGRNDTNTIASPPTTTSTNTNTNSSKEHRAPVSPAEDARSQTALEQMLQRSVHTSNRVTWNDIDSPETNLTSIPPDLDRGDTCEVIPGHSLKPYTIHRPNGIQVFSSKEFASSETFLMENEPSLQSFAVILERLCVGVFNIPLSSIAIYHDPAGVSIAFNRNKALHFNFRFFHGLHYLTGKYQRTECYAYWYVTICHELAHHLVSGHTKEHGFYCENFNQLYMPKLITMLQNHNVT